jgi:hypothetical protein
MCLTRPAEGPCCVRETTEMSTPWPRPDPPGTSIEPEVGLGEAYLFTFFHRVSGPENDYETALELVSGVNLRCVLNHFPNPTLWNGSRGQVRLETCQKPNKNYGSYYLF